MGLGEAIAPARSSLALSSDASRSAASKRPRRERRQQIDELADRIAIYAARLDAGEHQLLTTIRRFEQLGGWRLQGARSCAAWLAYRIGIGLNTAREKVRVAVALGELPQMDEALRRGRISYAKARAMTRVATPTNEQLLMAQARGTTGAQLERICARFRRFLPGALTSEEARYVRRRTSRDGTIKIEMSLLPDEAELVLLALHERRDRLATMTGAKGERRPQPTLADAAVDIAQQAKRTQDSDHATFDDRIERTLFVHLTEESAALSVRPQHGEISAETPDVEASSAVEETASTGDGSARRFCAELDDGTPLCGETWRRLACDAGLVMAKRSGEGEVLDIGRKRRTLTSALSHALRVRDRTCRFPGCTRRAFLHAHHIEHWSNGGATSLSNLVRLCHFHHVAVHEGGFEVRRAGATFSFHDAEGRELPPVASPAEVDMSTSVTDQLAAEQRSDGVEIDRRTSLPKCPGLSFHDVDIDGCVNALIRRTEQEDRDCPRRPVKPPRAA